jgi:hypothetical protein
VKEVQAPFGKQVESADALKTSVSAEERRWRYSEQKTKRMAARAKQQMEQKRQRPEPGILAFGGEDSRSRDFWN